MNTLRPEDIYCDNMHDGKKVSTVKTVSKNMDPTSRPVKPRKKLHRKSLERKLKVRRNLFGPVDHEKTDSFLQQELDILSDLSNKKWNFDFGKEEPLDGPWHWESVGPRDPTVPPAYRGTIHKEDQHLQTKCDDVQRSCSEVTNPLVLSTGHGDVNVVSGNLKSSSLMQSSCVRPSIPRDVKRKRAALQPTLKGYLTVKKTKLTNVHSLDKTKRNGAKDKSTSTVLHIIQSVSPTKPFVLKDNIAL